MKTTIVDGGEFANQNPPLMPAGLKIFSGRFAVAVWFLAMAIFVLPANAWPVQLLSARNASVPLPAGGDDNSVAPGLSSDGRFVLFTSAANDLVPGGNNFYSLNVYRRDRASNTTVLVSVNLNNTGGGNGSSMLGQASTNGQFVVFQSDANNLVPNDTNSVTDIFVRDLVAGTTTLVSASTNGGPANGISTDPVMTPDGRYVAFISRASNLVAGDTNKIPDIFIRDLVAGTNQLVSVGALGSTFLSPGVIMATPVMTPDGRYVAFFSLATNLVSGVPGTTTGEVYVRDRLAGTTTWASTNAAAMVSALFQQPNATSYHPQLSDDGRYVAFKAGTTASTGVAVILQYDSTTGATTVVNTNGIGGSVNVDETYGPEMTPDGRFIAFARHEGATNSGFASVHVWDAQGAVDTLVSDDGSGVPTNTTSHTPVISPDGRFVVFLSNATNLTGNAVSNGLHVFLRDLQSSTTQLVDADTNGIGSTDDYLSSFSLSTDGRLVAFDSPDGSLVSRDNNRAADVFVRDLVAGTTELVSQRDATVIPQAAYGDRATSSLSVSADGRWVAFVSQADDLVPNDTNRVADVFVRDVVNGTNLLVSVGSDGGPALGGQSISPAISADGRYVVFISSATNLVAGLYNTNNNIFRRDLLAGTTVLVSVGSDGVSPGNNDSSGLVISPDGRYVAFLSLANNLVPGMSIGMNTYWRDINLGQTVGLPTGSPFFTLIFRPSMGGNGRYVAYAYGYLYESLGQQLKIWDTQLGKDIYTNMRAPTAVAIDPPGTKILYWSAHSSAIVVDNIATGSNLFSINSMVPVWDATCWSDDGRWLVFISTTNVGSGDGYTNKVYLKDFQTGTLSLIGSAGPGHPSSSFQNASPAGPVISGNGRFVAYRSIVTNTVPGDNSIPPKMCLLDRLTGSNIVLTTGQSASSPNAWVSRPVISDNGATIAFLNLGCDLVTGDLNRMPDAFGVQVDVNAALVDSDGDGIPDWWMMKYFGRATGQEGDQSRALDDADGDGASNIQEYLAGTSPISSTSVFRLLATGPANSKLNLTWPALLGRSYQVQYKTNLDDPAWLTIPGSVWVLGNQGYYIAPAALPHSFYRVFESY